MNPNAFEALTVVCVAFGGLVVTVVLAKFFALFCTIMRYWPHRKAIPIDVLRAGFRPFSRNAPVDLMGFLPLFTVMWPIGLVAMIIITLFKLIEGPYLRYVKYTNNSVLPAWISWKKLASIVNKGAE
jgi:hypothetical protein